MIEFIERTYVCENENAKLAYDSDTGFLIPNKKITFKNLVYSNNISIILGEPASGKTFQLQEYKKLNKNSEFVELLTLELDDEISKNTDIVLLDSIDEALSQNDSDKKLISKLLKYIQKCKDVNLKIKFVITCRELEWKETFEEKLKELDKNLHIYKIQDLEKEEINLILKDRDVYEVEFWNFIEDNYLDELLKNILMTIHLIDDFDDYKGKSLRYYEIYEKIINKHLLDKTDNERDKRQEQVSPKDMLNISSIIATYMTLNKKITISIENYHQLAKELYELNNIEITAKKLEIVCNTALFQGTIKNTKFFHKSIQEYLTAYFINKKQLDITTIKKIFAHKMGFYEEFEEVLIYLTNIQEKFFKHFVKFDPLIFRRHPYLSKDEQISLLESVINLLQDDRQKAWNKRDYLEDSSLTRLDLLDNIDVIIRKKIDIKNVNAELFVFFKGLLEHSYSSELENMIFEILENIKVDKRVCIEYMSMYKITNLNYNKRLLDFIIKNDLIDKHEDYLYLEIFSVLYGNVEFKKMIRLLENFLEYNRDILVDIDIKDIVFWLENIMDNSDKSNINYNDEQISFLIFLVLKSYKKLEDKSILEKIMKFVDIKHIHIAFYINDDEKDKYLLDFDDIKKVFWDYYFNQNKDDGYIFVVLDILWYYGVLGVQEIEEVSKKYAIKDYILHYLYLKNHMMTEDVEFFLMKEQLFSDYIKESKKKREEESEKLKIKHPEYYSNKEKREIKHNITRQSYEKDIKSLSTVDDVFNIFSIVQRKHREHEKVHQKLVDDLGEKYPYFIELIKKEFQNDISYLEIKDNLSTRLKKVTTMFDYLFKEMSESEVQSCISSKEEYEKLFYHCFSYHKLDKEYFYDISKRYKKDLIDISIYILRKSLLTSSHKTSNIDFQFINLYKSLKIFNSIDLKRLIDKIKQISNDNFILLEDNCKRNLLEILTLNIANYEFIKELLFYDERNKNKYFKALFTIDINRGIDDYNILYYPKGDKKLKYKTDCKIDFLKPIYKLNKFDVVDISPNHRASFKDLMSILYSLGGYREFNLLKNINDNNKKFILETYFNFFKEYYHPKGTYTPSIYDDMNGLIRYLFSIFKNDIDKIELLDELKESSNIELQTRIKLELEDIYNLRLKNRAFDNDYYKNILDKYKQEEVDNRFFNYEKLKNDLIDICLLETEHRKALSQLSEDEINDRFRTDLLMRSYNVADQSRGGESESTKKAGERDIVIRDTESGVAESIIEAFNLKGLDRMVIEKHYKKLIEKYDTVGNEQNFILIYSKANNFQNLWKKYKTEYLNEDEYDTKKDNLKVGFSKEKNMTIVHLFVNFYSVIEN